MPSWQDTIRIRLGSATVGIMHHFPEIIRNWAKSLPSEVDSQARKCFIFGVANYPNIGDLAISLAEKEFLHRIFGNNVIAVDFGKLWSNLAAIKKAIGPHDIVCLQGGGNMGGLYSPFEFERCSIISLFPRNRIVIMPQTIHYRCEDLSLRNYSQITYSKHNDLHLFAREQNSLNTMRELYPEAFVSLTPDIVLSLDMSDHLLEHPSRSGTLLAFRNDPERALNSRSAQKIQEILAELGKNYMYTDTTAPGSIIAEEDRVPLIAEKIREFQQAELIITDRLHGMIFAVLAGTPCVALDNIDHKVKGVYQWLESVPYLSFANNVDELPGKIRATLEAGPGVYSNSMLMDRYTPLIEALS